ncbi:hypothetical protein A3D77_06530 [Candidatus Gottesmanbacteria bacterium RIFCSPHIGHO2_02_FULL_39_11]|uniref:Uncharacterized protein n=1 Tax=Candidatus Gottesmanbacteria bacterium RIFCSPHIGHO2_02_FULL_39_11 TaxID=1798382 RepID=A0A1F5ZTR2_9BACT|nr:MAG: hypothetical protein A3D77_06530 [Candidatus Gottesmanbacteria bacterium RIFCSPHIGHO2_02_FULL_39_11]
MKTIAAWFIYGALLGGAVSFLVPETEIFKIAAFILMIVLVGALGLVDNLLDPDKTSRFRTRVSPRTHL